MPSLALRRHRLIPSALLAVCIAAGVCGQAVAARLDPYDAEVVQTNADLSQRLTPLTDLEFGSANLAARPVVRVDAAVRYQRVQGFGASMTDTSAWLIERQTSPPARAALMDELFGCRHPTELRPRADGSVGLHPRWPALHV